MVVDLGPLAGLKRSGIYALSVPCVKTPKITKIGKAKDLRARIDQYQLYYPFGVALELLWIFPRGTRNVDQVLQQMEQFIHAQLDPVHTLSRRRQTEWFWNTKEEIAEAFLKAREIVRNGLLVNPAFHYSVSDMSAQERRDNMLLLRAFRFSAAHLVARFACAFLFAAHLYRFKRERRRREGAVKAVVNRIGE